MISLNSTLTLAKRAGVTIGIGAACYLQPYRPMVFVGHSMEPTYQTHSMALTEPVKEDDLKRGQVVVINMESGPIVKRIAFAPGDSFLQTYLDGHWVDMIYVRPTAKSHLNPKTMRTYVVPKGMVYVLGDNLEVSMDSRMFGCVPTSQIDRILVDQRPFDPLKNWHQETLREQ